MKNYSNNRIFKKIALALVVFMVFNFAMPKFSFASDDGGIIFRPVSGLLRMVSDLVIKGVQKIFTGDGEIKSPSVTQKRYVSILNDSESFDDFLADAYKSGYIYDSVETFSGAPIVESDYKNDLVTWLNKHTDKGYSFEKWKTVQTAEWKNIIQNITNEDKETLFSASEDAFQEISVYSTQSNEDILQYGTYSIKYGPAVIFSGDLPVFDINFINPMETEEIVEENQSETENAELKLSSAAVLRSVVSRWYQDLQKLALIGLLSVLVYVAIRMIISSTGEDKAKYKKMLMDWLVAMCIIFVLHYIMVFVLNITSSINEVFKSTAIGKNSEDVLMSSIRNEIGSEENYIHIFANIIMYMALVIFTVMFTIQYLKRVIYMAFLTIIAPLIALTYPLDKIKDGQAQAFSMWIKEYIFNALIQPIHLMLYVVLVGSATDLMETYPLLAVVAIGFLVPAEKFFRDMFGFNKADSVSTLGSVAGGAAVMSMVNHIKGGKGAKAGSSNGEKESNSSRIRTTNPLGALQNGRNINTESINSSVNKIEQEQKRQNASVTQEALETEQKEDKIEENIIKEEIKKQQKEERTEKQRRIDGVKQVLKGKPKNFAKKAIRFTAKTAGKLAFGTIGIAAGVTSGDFEKSLKYGAGGAIAGGAIGGRLADGAINTPKNIEDAIYGGLDTYREGAYDRETAQNMKFDRQFKRSERGKELISKYSEDAVQQCLEAGITDSDEIGKILNSYEQGKAGSSVGEAIAFNHLAKNCPDSILNGSSSNLRRYLSFRGIEIDEGRADEIQRIMNSLK